MPIKLPKGFQRRKSSGNALEELPNPPEPSFRVFERPGVRSFDGGNALKRMSQGRPLSAGHIEDDQLYASGGVNNINSNRGSGGTNNSASSGGHDNSSSSARFSSSSTLPSSTDLPLDDRAPPNSKDPYNMPALPVPEPAGRSLRAAGRAFSFGRKKAESSSTPAPRPIIPHAMPDHYAGYNRERAQTESSYASESTTTPPKLLDGGLELSNSDMDGFGSMFENFGKRRSQITLNQSQLGFGNTESPEPMSPSGPRMLTKSYFGEPSPNRLSPNQLDRSHDYDTSPRSCTSHDSHDNLMYSGNSAPMERTFSYEDEPPAPRSGPGISKSRTMPVRQQESPGNRDKQQRPSSRGGLRRSSLYRLSRESDRHPGRQQDQDARLVMDSVRASQRLNRQSSGQYPDSDEEADNPRAALVPNSSYPPSPYAVPGAQEYAREDDRNLSPKPLFDSSDRDFSAKPWGQESADTTPRAKKRDLAHQEERSMFDISPEPSNRAQPPPANSKPIPKPDTQNKVMTPAQFEHYRRQQEMIQSGSQPVDHDVSDEEGDDYEDDDEIERNKQLARQRRKQEAHLAVYRQQMMKMTGEQPSDLPALQQRPGMDRSSASAPNLQERSVTPTFSFEKPVEAGSKASDEEDEDVPLGVLAAHGFPSKNRPPNAVGNAGNILYKSESYPPPPASAGGASGAGLGGLPPFAKNLPPDPYFGAGLINPSNREAPGFGQSGPGSAYGGSQPTMPRGGLVGVIAGEERARAARRGSPNPQGGYSSPLPQGMAQFPMGMPPGMPPIMSAGEQATVQMSEQMKQMMQMQMQWMQQMQQMMAGGMQPGQQPPFTPTSNMQQEVMNTGMLAPPGQTQRPMTGSHSAPGSPAGQQLGQQRAMSMMGTTSNPPWPQPLNINRHTSPGFMSGGLNGPGPGYTTSIAPSERSNVGMPSRYRPVSIAPADEHASRPGSRASTFTGGALQPEIFGRNSRLSSSGDRQSKLSVAHTPIKKAVSDDDDEEGWEEMMKQKQKKKSVWRLNKKKDESVALDVYNFPDS